MALPALPAYEVSEAKALCNEDLTRLDNQNDPVSHGKRSHSTTLETSQRVSVTDVGLNSTQGSGHVHSNVKAADQHFRKSQKPITLRYHILSCFCHGLGTLGILALSLRQLVRNSLYDARLACRAKDK
jgi:hypothetical protein